MQFKKKSDSGRPRPFDYLIKMEKLLNKGSKDVKSTGAANLKVIQRDYFEVPSYKAFFTKNNST